MWCAREQNTSKKKKEVPYSEKIKEKGLPPVEEDNLCVRAKKNKRDFFFSLAVRHTQKLL